MVGENNTNRTFPQCTAKQKIKLTWPRKLQLPNTLPAQVLIHITMEILGIIYHSENEVIILIIKSS